MTIVAVDRDSGRVDAELVIDENIRFDDHNVPAITQIATGELLIGHTGHGVNSQVTLTRVSYRAGSLALLSQWSAPFPENCTYVYFVPSLEGTVIMFTRSIQWNWSTVIIDTHTWQTSEPQLVFPWEIDKKDHFYSGRDGNRPYLVIRKARNNSWVFALTNDHPRAYRNGIFAGRIRGLSIEDLEGNEHHRIGSGDKWAPFEDLTEITPSGSLVVPWIHDIAETPAGEVLIATSGREKSSREFRRNKDRVLKGFRYEVNVWTSQGVDQLLAVAAGSSLYDKEEDYVGGIALNPRNPFHVVFSSNALPTATRSADMWHLWEVQADSEHKEFRRLSKAKRSIKNIRPVFSEPRGEGLDSSGHSLYFLSGRYSTYRDIDSQVSVIPFTPDKSCFT